MGSWLQIFRVSKRCSVWKVGSPMADFLEERIFQHLWCWEQPRNQGFSCIFLLDEERFMNPSESSKSEGSDIYFLSDSLGVAFCLLRHFTYAMHEITTSCLRHSSLPKVVKSFHEPHWQLAQMYFVGAYLMVSQSKEEKPLGDPYLFKNWHIE